MIHDLVASPAEFAGAIGQGVLAGGGFPMVEDLLGRGLPDVDDGGPGGVPGLELGDRAGAGRSFMIAPGPGGR